MLNFDKMVAFTQEMNNVQQTLGLSDSEMIDYCLNHIMGVGFTRVKEFLDEGRSSPKKTPGVRRFAERTELAQVGGYTWGADG